MPSGSSQATPPSAAHSHSVAEPLEEEKERRGKKMKVAENPKPCLVCGVQYSEMPKGSKYCFTHKADVGAYFAQLKADVKADPGN